MLGGVFISYRREDAGGIAGRIYDRLVNRLGHDNVFFDVDTIPPGRDFVDMLSDRVGKCDALVAVIGKRWVASVDDANRRRLDDPNDFVRIEIEAALQRDVPVIPVLVDNAAMPQAVELPDVLKKLARRQGIEISHNRFETDAERLTEALARIEEQQPGRSFAAGVAAAPSTVRAPSPASPPARAVGARRLIPLGVAALAIVAGAGFFYEQRGAHEEQSRQQGKAKPASDVLKALPPPPQTTSALNTAATPPAPDAVALQNAAADPQIRSELAALGVNLAPADSGLSATIPKDVTDIGKIISLLRKLDRIVGLKLEGVPNANLDPLKDLTDLQTLDLSGTWVADLAPLQGLHALQTLNLRETSVADVRPLAVLTALENLYLAGTKVGDLGPLKQLTVLQVLGLNGTLITDLSPLSGLTALRELHVEGTQVTDLDPLKALIGASICVS